MYSPLFVLLLSSATTAVTKTITVFSSKCTIAPQAQVATVTVTVPNPVCTVAPSSLSPSARQVHAATVNAAATGNFGSCKAPSITFAIQPDRPNQDAFGLDPNGSFNHGSALNFNVIESFVCGQLSSQCKAPAAANCPAAIAAATAQSTPNGKIVAFLNALGVPASAQAAPAAVQTSPPVQSSPPPASSAPSGLNCNAQILQVIVKGQEHRFGLDNQQVALRAPIPIQRICQHGLGNNPSQACTAACASAGTAASGAIGFSGADNAAQLQAMGVAADAFNAALGTQTDFTNNPIFQ